MAGRTLWGAMDRDRLRWIRAAGIVLLLLVLLGFALWFLTVVRSPRAFELVFRILVPLGAILTFPLVKMARELRVGQTIGAVPVATGMLPDSKSALHDVSLAAGLFKPPVLLMYFADAVNAFATTRRGTLSIAVSSAFSELPRAQQRAGFAMLVGRSRVDTTSFAAEHQLSESMREDSLPPDRDPVLFSAWLDTAVAGDREGLRILSEPAPMIELLELLSITPTDVPGFAYSGGHDAVFGFLAWPYFDTGKVLAEEGSSESGGLPPRAAAAVAALIAEERTMSGGLSGIAGRASLSGAEAIRALRLREVAGAEGAIAGSTTAAARRGAVRPKEAAPVDGNATTTRGRTVGAAVTTISVPVIAAALAVGTGGAGALSSSGPGTAAATAVTALSGTSPVAPEHPAQRGVERITVRCPSCSAGNAPGNRVCVVCGKRMPQGD